jgi:hypothetical protein
MGPRTTTLAVLLVLAAPVAALAAPANPVVSALRKTAAAKSTRMTIAMSTHAQGQRVTTTGTAVQRGTDVHMTMRIGAGALAVPMEAVALVESGHFVMYLKSPVLASQLPAGKSWLKIDLQKQGSLLGVDFSSLLNSSPTQSPRVVASGLVSTRRLGTARISGRPTTRYHVVVDLDRAAAANPAMRGSIARIEQLTGKRRVPEDVWVGPDGRVSRLRFTSAIRANGVQATTTATMTYVAYDVPVRIVAPPPAQVVETS